MNHIALNTDYTLRQNSFLLNLIRTGCFDEKDAELLTPEEM